MTATPSGAQFELVLGDQRAVVTEVGATLRLYQVGPRDVILSFAEHQMCVAGAGAVLLPWPNRIGDGRYEWSGQVLQLALTEPARGNAIHGLARWERWVPVDRSDSRVTLRLDLVPQPGYPFALRSEITYSLGGSGLEVTLATRNLGDRDAPYGAGFHPWLSPGDASLDDCILTIDADRYVRVDDRMLPVVEEAVPEGLDFRGGRPIAGAQIDHAFVDARCRDGRSWVLLASPDGRTAAAWAEPGMGCWQVFTGDLPHLPSFARKGLAAEPMTCVADAFRNGRRLVRLAPGQGHTVRWGLTLT
jgi:aldose 1-epimerase